MSQQSQVTVNVPANGQSRDVFLGQPLRFIRSRGVVQIGLTAAAGAALGDILADVTIGGRSVVTGFSVGVEAAAGAGPLADRDIKITSPVKPGDEILVNLQNTTAGAIDVTAFANLPLQS